MMTSGTIRDDMSKHIASVRRIKEFSPEMKERIAELTENCVKYITNNDLQNIELTLTNLPEELEMMDLKNNDGLTLLHMAAFKNQQKSFN